MLAEIAIETDGLSQRPLPLGRTSMNQDRSDKPKLACHIVPEDVTLSFTLRT